MDSRQDFFQNVCCLYFEAGGVDTGMAAEIFVLQQVLIDQEPHMVVGSFIRPRTLTEPGVMPKYSSMWASSAKESLAELICLTRPWF